MHSVETTLQTQTTPPRKPGVVFRVDVLPSRWDMADKVTTPLLGEVMTTPVYWFYAEAPLNELIPRIAQELLIDPVLQQPIISSAQQADFPLTPLAEVNPRLILEKQFLPGVTDNLGNTVARNLALLFPQQALPAIEAASGTVYWVQAESPSSLDTLAHDLQYQLYNPLIERLIAYPADELSSHVERFHFPHVFHPPQKAVAVFPLDGSDEDLMRLSQSGNLALTLAEMHVIRDYYQRPETQAAREKQGLPIWPTDVELEILAQTWSEHCKHKIFAAKIRYTDATDPDHPITSEIDGLFKTYIAGSTRQLMPTRPDLLSVFEDNAGVLQWDENTSVCFKVETHNSPSALEPYGGALTGIVGVNRDILGTGLGAKPLFNTDVFCFAHPDEPHVKHEKMLPAEAILQGVRKGVEDGGNKSGIPTVNGALVFDPRYRAKPLVFCGTGGLLPLKVGDKIGYRKYTQPGDTIVMAGGRVGKDGIHGATFSSEALNEDSPVSAVQIGDPITQKRMLDFLEAARAQDLLTGITDNGAGGLSSSVGEMAQLTGGATIDVDKVPLKYPGLAAYEIVISESQERMTLSTNRFEDLIRLAKEYDVEVTDIGRFHDRGVFEIIQNGKVVASLDLDFLHHGLPQMELDAYWECPRTKSIRSEAPEDATPVLLKLLSSPNICSREALIRQYDHEVQGRSVIKPLMGPHQTAPCDAAVLQPILGQPQGLVVSNGICPQYSDWDTYAMASCAVDEAIRNAVAVGANPKTIALLDNFCWPDPLPSERNPDASFKLAQLVRANQALYDCALSFGTPFISGKDSMKNDFDDGSFRLSIPPTLLVSAIGKIPDINKAVSMDFKAPGDAVYLLGKTNVHMGGSQYYRHMGWYAPYCPRVTMALAREIYKRLYECIQAGWIRSCHDLSEGGLAVALAECVLGTNLGLDVSIRSIVEDSPELRWDEALFSESPSRFVLSVAPEHCQNVENAFSHMPLLPLGTVLPEPVFRVHLEERMLVATDTASLRMAWQIAPAQCYAGGMQP